MADRRCGYGSCEQRKLRVQCEDTSDISYARHFASMFSVKVLELSCSTKEIIDNLLYGKGK